MSEPTNPMTPESYRKARAKGKLVQETEWMRVYELEPERFRYESKFLTGEVQMSADSFSVRWPAMTRPDRMHFLVAYQEKSDFTAEDERIVDIIMEDGDDHIWSCLALFMIRHPQQSRVLALFRERLETNPQNRFIYIEALGGAKDVAAVPILRSYFDIYRTAVDADESAEIPVDSWIVWEFLNCCEALWKITGLEEYANHIRKYLQHPESRVRWQASHALSIEQP